MALFNCSECGYEFSDKADACPKCGCPNTPGGMTPIGPPPQQKKPKKKVTTFQAFLIVLGIGVPGLFVYSLGRTLIEVHLCNAEVSSGCESILSRRGNTEAEGPLWSQEKDGF